MTVTALRQTLTEADIRRLIRGESEEERADAAHRICRRVDAGELSAEERAYAQEILKIIVADTAALVRRAMAVTLKNSPVLPRDVAVKLANDIDSVALPILKHSPVLTDEDLIEIVRAAPPAKQIAVAGRPQVSGPVCEAIAEHAVKGAVRVLAANDGARLSGRAFAHTLRRFQDDDEVKSALISRDFLPPVVAEKLVTMVAGEMFDQLVNRHGLPPQVAIDLATGARERATLDLAEQAGRQRNLAHFAQQLNLQNRLTPSLVLRALCLGHIGFFEHAMAELAGVPHYRAWLLVHDRGALGLPQVLRAAGMPQAYEPVIAAAIDMFHDLELDGAKHDRERFRRRLLERLLTQTQAMPPAELTYLLEKLDATYEIPAAAAAA